MGHRIRFAIAPRCLYVVAGLTLAPAEKHPESEVLGTDLSPIQPDYVPPNCHFEVDDAEDEWVYSYKFDYVHGRYICPFLADIPKLLGMIYDNLNPGGYVEIMETLMLMKAIDDSLKDHPLQTWNQMMVEGRQLSPCSVSFIALHVLSPLRRYTQDRQGPSGCSPSEEVDGGGRLC